MSSLKFNFGLMIDFGYACVYPIVWSVAILTLSGELGSFENTHHITWWLVSWFTTPVPAELTLINLYLRKIGHLCSYGLLYFLWFKAFHGDMALDRRIACLYSLGLCLLLASMDEGRQSFYPSRGSSFWDVSLDMGGAGLGALITFAVWTSKNNDLKRRSSKTRLL